MALSNDFSAADIAAITGDRDGDGFGGNNGAWWLIILFLFAAMGGWGNGFGNNGGGNMFPWLYLANNTDNGVQRGFDTAAVTGQLSGIQSSISNGFANAEVAECNRAMNAMQTAYNNQIASMNQNFASAQSLDNRLDTLAMNLQECCCENRANIADLKYTVATEACADRAAVNDALRDVIASNTANTQAILDKLCQQEIDALKTQNANLQTQINMANLAASQTAQTARLLADNATQTQQIENYIRPQINPAYIVPNPYANYGYSGGFGCGCGNGIA